MLVRQGVWEQVRPGAYVDKLVVVEHFDALRLRGLARIAAIDAKLTSEHVFTRESAALIHGLPLVSDHEVAHLVRPFKQGVRDADDVVGHTNHLPKSQCEWRHGLPVTTLERTIVDCAMFLPRHLGLVIADAGLHVGADPQRCSEILRGLAGRRGVNRARQVMELADDGAESPGETSMRFTVILGGLPDAETQVRIETARGVYWADLGWPAVKVVLEYDGKAKYEANGSAADAVLAEKRRQEAMEAEGWLVIRVTSDDLRDPEPLLAQTRAALRSRSARAA